MVAQEPLAAAPAQQAAAGPASAAAATIGGTAGGAATAPPQALGAASAPSEQPHYHSRTMQATGAAGQPIKRGGGRKGGRRTAAAAAAAEPEELVRLGPEVARNSERLRTGWHPVQLSAEDKAAEVELDDAQLSASSRAGYRMVRATHGAYSGTWYFEVRINQLGPTGAARVGWCTRQAELNAPVGADENGYSYRSLEGSKVHKGWRDEYGEPYGEGDVVGCLLHLPEGGRPFEQGVSDVVKYQGKLYFQEMEPAQPQPLAGAFVAFSRNGVLQGKAYTDIREGTYYPAISLYTNRGEQDEAASAAANFGEQGFAFPPPAVEGCPPPRPAFELSGPRPAAAAGAGLGARPPPQQPGAQQPPAPVQQQLGEGMTAQQPQQQEHQQREASAAAMAVDPQPPSSDQHQAAQQQPTEQHLQQEQQQRELMPAAAQQADKQGRAPGAPAGEVDSQPGGGEAMQTD